MIVKVKLEHENAKMPVFIESTNAGADVFAARIIKKNIFKAWYGLGFKTQIPRGYYADLRSRSSISKKDLTLANSVGTIDSNFRGEWQVRFNYTIRGVLLNIFTLGLATKDYKVGERIAQIVIKRKENTEFRKAKRLTKTARDEGGFGSTGTK